MGIVPNWIFLLFHQVSVPFWPHIWPTLIRESEEFHFHGYHCHYCPIVQGIFTHMVQWWSSYVPFICRVYNAFYTTYLWMIMFSFQYSCEKKNICEHVMVACENSRIDKVIVIHRRIKKVMTNLPWLWFL